MSDDPQAKPFLEHLDDLRWVIVKSAVALGIGMVICFALATKLLDVLEWPLRQAGIDPAEVSVVLHPADPFFIQMQISMIGGIILSLPFVLYFIGGFILPALTSREKKYLFPTLIAGTVLFLIGLTFCFFLVLPQTFSFLKMYTKLFNAKAEWTLQNFVDFTLQMLLGMGLAFEFPLVLMLFNILGILSSKTLSEYRRHAIVLSVFLACCITPSPDPFSLGVIAVPLYVLYEGCIWLTRLREMKLGIKPEPDDEA